MTTLESNKLIAEFIGLKGTNNCIRDESGKYYDYHATPLFSCIKEQEITIESEWGIGLVEQDYLFLEDLKFHSSYDWLMSVVEKIERLDLYKYSVKIQELNCVILNEGVIISVVNSAETKIQAVYQAVIKFILWYNENRTN